MEQQVKKMPKGIYRRGNLFWIRYAGIDGKMIFEPSGSDKMKVAEQLLHKRKADLAVGKQPEIIKIKNHLFRELAEEYIKWCERQRCFSRKIYMIQQLVAEFGHYPLRRFSTMQVEQFQTERLKTCKPATVNRHLATLKHMFTKACDWNMVEEEVLKRIRKVKMIQENNRRLRYLTKEECQRLVNACSNHLKPIVITALNTGMRKEEILSLKWSNVDLVNGFILLDVTKNGNRREIPINSTLKATLQSIIRRIDTDYVFYEEAIEQVDGKEFRKAKRFGNVRKSFLTACRRANIRDFHFHDLRHCFASHLVMAGVDITSVKELLGHASLTMTMRYSHLAPSHKVKAVDILDNAINENVNYTKTIQNERGCQ